MEARLDQSHRAGLCLLQDRNTPMRILSWFERSLAAHSTRLVQETSEATDEFVAYKAVVFQLVDALLVKINRSLGQAIFTDTSLQTSSSLKILRHSYPSRGHPKKVQQCQP